MCDSIRYSFFLLEGDGGRLETFWFFAKRSVGAERETDQHYMWRFPKRKSRGPGSGEMTPCGIGSRLLGMLGLIGLAERKRRRGDILMEEGRRRRIARRGPHLALGSAHGFFGADILYTLQWRSCLDSAVRRKL